MPMPRIRSDTPVSVSVFRTSVLDSMLYRMSYGAAIESFLHCRRGGAKMEKNKQKRMLF